jgi:hypothetical protein
MAGETFEKLDYDEKSLKEKIKGKTGIFALIGTGILSVLHTLSHIVPAIGVLGLSLGEKSPWLYKIVSNEYLQLAYLPFVVISFWYIYRDHQHHKHEHELRARLQKAEAELEKLKKK